MNDYYLDQKNICAAIQSVSTVENLLDKLQKNVPIMMIQPRFCSVLQKQYENIS
jgi:hypothetical protein